MPGNEEELVARALSRAGLRPPERFFLQFPHELSGGQRQRVVIAGALVLEPRVIVADEPVSNLDASVRGEILRLLLKLRAESRISILIVTHDLGLAWTVADRVAVMYLGRIVEVGPTKKVLTAASPSVHACPAGRGARSGRHRTAAAIGRAAGSHQDPAGMPVPSPMSCAVGRESRIRTRGRRLPRRRPDPGGAGRGPLRRMPPGRQARRRLRVG